MNLDRNLLTAIKKGKATQVKKLLSRGADPNYRNPNGERPLVAAAEKGKLPIVSDLITHGADLNQEDKHKNTPLIVAIAKTFFPIVKELLAGGANPNLQNALGQTPLYLAMKFYALTFTDSKGITKTKKIKEFQKILNDYYEIAIQLLAHGADPNIQNYLGETPLFIITESAPFLYLVELLIKDGADPNIPDRKGQTALMNVADLRLNLDLKSSVILYLLNHGADPNLINQKGESAFFILTRINYDLRIIKAMIAHGADPNLQDRKGNTVLMNTMIYLFGIRNMNEVRSYLLNHGANPNIQNINGSTPFMWAVTEGNRSLIREMIEHGADPTLKANDGRTAFNFIPKINKPSGIEIERILRKAAKHLHSKTPIPTATPGPSPPTLTTPTTPGPPSPTLTTPDPPSFSQSSFSQQPSAPDPALTNPENGVTNLMLLASNPDKFPLMEELFPYPEEIRPIVNQQDDQGNTALLYAAANNPHPEVLKFLLQSGANPLIKNDQGYSALDYARNL